MLLVYGLKREGPFMFTGENVPALSGACFSAIHHINDDDFLSCVAICFHSCLASCQSVSGPHGRQNHSTCTHWQRNILV